MPRALPLLACTVLCSVLVACGGGGGAGSSSGGSAPPPVSGTPTPPIGNVTGVTTPKSFSVVKTTH